MFKSRWVMWGLAGLLAGCGGPGPEVAAPDAVLRPAPDAAPSAPEALASDSPLDQIREAIQQAGGRPEAVDERVLGAYTTRAPEVASYLHVLIARRHKARWEDPELRAASEVSGESGPVRPMHQPVFGVAEGGDPWIGEARWLAGWHLDDCDDRRWAVWLDQAEGHPERVPPVEVAHLKASRLTRCKRTEEALAAWQAFAVMAPGDPRLKQGPADLALSIDQRLRQARTWDKAARYDKARAVLELLLREEGQPPEALDEARLMLGKLYLSRMRSDFDVARLLFREVAQGRGPRQDEGAWQMARAEAKLADGVEGVLAAYDRYLATQGRGKHRGEAAFFKAFARYEAGQYLKAAEGFAAIRGSWRSASRWYHAWSLYLGQDAGAAEALTALSGRRGRYQRQATYWAGRARLATEPEVAQALFKRLLEADAHDWYALLVRAQWPEVYAEFMQAHLASQAGAEPSGASTGAALTGDPAARVARIRAFLRAGLTGAGQMLLAEAEPSLRKAGAWGILLDLARELEDHQRLHRATSVWQRKALALPLTPDNVGYWRDAHPLAFFDLAQKVGQTHGVDPERIEAFILKESAFDPDAVSHANARGLMQLLDKTARRIVEARGPLGEARPAGRRPDLYDPATNLDLGAWYLSALGRRFKGQLPLIAAAYNAGPGSVIQWLKASGSKPIETDLFVETIPFKEARRYVKRLVAHEIMYRTLGTEPGQPKAAAADLSVLPLRLDPRVAPGVDF